MEEARFLEVLAAAQRLAFEKSPPSLAKLKLEDHADLVSASREVLNWAAYNRADFEQFESYVNSASLDDQQKQWFAKWWRANSSSVFEKARQKSVQNNQLQKFGWRIDTKTAGKSGEEGSGEATTIVEMLVGPSASNTDVLRFEMDRAQLDSMMQQMNNIQEQIQHLIAK